MNFTLNSSSGFGLATDICLTPQGAYSPECLYTHFCPQFSHYFINTGIAVICIYLGLSWALWLFWNHLHKLFDWDKLYLDHPAAKDIKRIDLKLFYVDIGLGDLREQKVKLYWDGIIRDLMAKMLLGFCVVVVYLSIAG